MLRALSLRNVASKQVLSMSARTRKRKVSMSALTPSSQKTVDMQTIRKVKIKQDYSLEEPNIQYSSFDSVSKRLFKAEVTAKEDLNLLPESVEGVEKKNKWVENDWSSLGVAKDELDLSLTLPTGQTFRWRHFEDGTWSGVVGSHIVSLRQTIGDVLFMIHPSKESPQPKKQKARRKEAVPLNHKLESLGTFGELAGDRLETVSRLRDFLNLDAAQLSELYKGFSAADSRFAALSAHLGGARLLRQDPLECLFSFICSSNNHISRITGMVDHLSQYGTYLGSVNGHTFHKFPTLEQLEAADEQTLRKAGFGYRAKYVEGTVKELLSKPEGGHQWLLNMRTLSLEDAVVELVTLPGIGPKVARCIALFSLDKHHCIPVDTHVWQLAIRSYTPELAGKSLTPRVHQLVADAFVKVFGPYAGWAHNILFIAELTSMRDRLPLHLHPPETPKKPRKPKTKGELEVSEVVLLETFEEVEESVKAIAHEEVGLRPKTSRTRKKII